MPDGLRETLLCQLVLKRPVWSNPNLPIFSYYRIFSCACFYIHVYGFYFSIEKRIILFKKIITFFTIKIFENLDNKNLNFSCDFSPIFEDPPITSLENTVCSLQIKGEVLYLLFIFGFLKIRKNASFFVIFQWFFSGFRNIFSMIFQ